LPDPPAAEHVLGEGLQPIDGPGEPGLRRARRLELVPPAAEQRPEIGGQHREQACRRRHLACALVAPGDRIVRVGVAGVDLDQVVNEDQFEHVPKLHLERQLPLEQEREQAHVPGVLGVALKPALIPERDGPRDRLEPIDRRKEVEDALQALRLDHLPRLPAYSPAHRTSK
jgi:hypothetical protein